MVELVIRGTNEDEEHVELGAPEYVVGRDPQSTIQLKDNKVSRRHARLFLKGDSYWIEDLGSANGVVMGGRPISAACEVAIGARFEIGPFCLSIQDGGPAPDVALVGLSPPCQGLQFDLVAGELTIGRTAGNEIVIDDPSISRQHAKLRVNAQQVEVEDLNSSNGTFVNNERITSQHLKTGDCVRFGNVELRLTRHGEVAHGATGGRLLSRFKSADRTMQIAVVLGGLSIMLLGFTVVVAMRRTRPAEPTPVSAPVPSAQETGPTAAPAAPSADTSSPARLSAGASPEETYERSISAGLQAAAALVSRQQWQEAAGAFQKVLDLDPINREARRGLRDAELTRRQQLAIEAARTAISKERLEEALVKAQAIAESGPYAADADQIAQASREALAQIAVRRASEYCGKQEFKRCHDQVLAALEHRPDMAAARALLGQAESAMSKSHLPFVAWTAPQPQSAVELNRLYPDAEVRAVAQSFSEGKVEEAGKQVKSVAGRPGGAALRELVEEFRQTKASGDSLASSGNLQRAVAQWEEALRAESKIMPPRRRSKAGDEIRTRLAGELFKLGEEAFNRGRYAEASVHWLRGLKASPSDSALLGGISKLETRGSGLLAELPLQGELPADACRQLEEIIGMTQPTAAVHLEAQRRQASGCSQK